ncbi:MAG: hypothetical protein DMG27_18330 [Acidobacteria bacterium]|nr:MAG: hypothetical protein DMG27_18330 [Acidobacteriota bacterium]
MTLVLSAVAAGIAAAGVTSGEGAGQQVGGNRKAPEQLKLALAEARGLRPTWFPVHIVAMVLQAR